MFNSELTKHESYFTLKGRNTRFSKVWFCLLRLCLSFGNAMGDELDKKVEQRNQLKQSIELSAKSMIELQQNGGWAMAYAADGRAVFGEYRIKDEGLITVQHPATPGVGMALLEGYEAIRDQRLLDAAMNAGDALIAGQLNCGGFPHEFHPDDDKNRRATFDDNTTQSATRFLLELWQVCGEDRFKDTAKRSADFMLEAQYDNGGWPQMYPLREDHYSQYITLNDQAMMDVIRVLFLCSETLNESIYRKAAMKGVDCLLSLQGRRPQAGWAQQYTRHGEPADARRFEPTALSSSETIGVLELLKDVYLETGNKEYLRSAMKAIEWLKQSQLDNGKWARFYEYGTNTPLYSTEDGTIIYEVENARPGYSWQGSYLSKRLEEDFQKLMKAPLQERDKVLNDDGLRADIIIDRGLSSTKQLSDNNYWLSTISGSQKRFYIEKFGEDQPLPKVIRTGEFVENFVQMVNAYNILKQSEKD